VKPSKFKPLIEIVGVIAIVVSLLLLTYQLKRANEIAEAEATSTVYEMANEMMLSFVSDQNFRQAFLNANSDNSESLTDDEELVLAAWRTHYLNINEVAWKYNQLGLMSDEDMLLRYAEVCRVIRSRPSFAKDWEDRRNAVLPGFYSAVNEACKQKAK